MYPWNAGCNKCVMFNLCSFLPSVAEKRHPCSHLPFGFGPRNCVGMRLAILESKMALMEVISKYRIVVSPETEVTFLIPITELLHSVLFNTVQHVACM